jgi:hypothetical protein
MSRAMNLSISQSDVMSLCAQRKIGISAIEELPGGGVRLVCMSSSGAQELRSKCKGKLLDGDLRRTAHRPVKPLW